MKAITIMPGVGPTSELNLRVSVATLARVLFINPADGITMLALERTATLRSLEKKPEIIVKTKPFGGGVRLLKPPELIKRIGNFNYDSERSRDQNDFRIMINGYQWAEVKKICEEHLTDGNTAILDPSPVRELEEEFDDSIQVAIRPEDYDLTSKGMIISDKRIKTENVNARGIPTARVYYLFEAMLKDQVTIGRIMKNSRKYSDFDLQNMAHENALKGGKGRANATLTVPLESIGEFYRSIPANLRNEPVRFDGHLLDGNVIAVLSDINNF